MKKTHIAVNVRSALLYLLPLLLAACGGGGGGASTTSTTTNTSTTTVTDEVLQPVTIATAQTSAVNDGNIQLNVPTPTYAVGSPQSQALAAINTIRGNCGFGLLKHNSILDASTENHMKYWDKNGFSMHTEASGNSGFTGEYQNSRITYAGYADLVRSDELVISTTNITDSVLAGVRMWFSAPWHSLGLLKAHADVGIAARMYTNGVGGIQARGIVVNTAQSATSTEINQAALAGTTGDAWDAVGAKNLSSDVLAMYPCEGSTAVSTKMGNESPTPVPGRNQTTDPIGGALTFVSSAKSVLTINSVTLQNLDTGLFVGLLPPNTKATSPYSGMIPSYATVVIIDKPLTQNTRYKTTVTYSINGISYPPKTGAWTTSANY